MRSALPARKDELKKLRAEVDQWRKNCVYLEEQVEISEVRRRTVVEQY